jgi:hypothetical protein
MPLASAAAVFPHHIKAVSQIHVMQRNTVPRPKIAIDPHPDEELDAFPSESGGTGNAAASARRARPAMVAALVIAVCALAGVAAWSYRNLPLASVGTLRVESDPTGAEVTLDGTVRGKTPLALTAPGGEHQLILRTGNRVQQLTVSVTTGAQTIHHVSLAAASGGGEPSAAGGSSRGGLQVVTDRVGAPVAIDGVPRGVSPLLIADLAAGNHQVEVGSGATAQRRTVEIHGGSVASLVLGASNTPTSGWMTVAAPLALQIFEDGRLIGTSEADRIMLTTGAHQLELSNEALGFRTRSSVRIEPGQTARVRVDLPRGSLSVNATPWAEVLIDGERVGETPLGNLQQPIGTHQIEFRHPQLGSKRVTATVSLKDATRIAVDMRTP